MEGFKELIAKSLNKKIADKDVILSNILDSIKEEENINWIKTNLHIVILLLLNRSDNYGNGLVKEVGIIGKKRLEGKEGSIYPILHNLEQKKFIESYWILDHEVKKKYYKITRKGKCYLEEKENIITNIKNDKKLTNKEVLIWP